MSHNDSSASLPVCKGDSEEMRTMRTKKIFDILYAETTGLAENMVDVLSAILHYIGQYAYGSINANTLRTLIERDAFDKLRYPSTQEERIIDQIMQCINASASSSASSSSPAPSSPAPSSPAPSSPAPSSPAPSSPAPSSPAPSFPKFKTDTEEMRDKRAAAIYEILYNETSGSLDDMDVVLKEIMQYAQQYADGAIDEDTLGHSVEMSAYDRLGYHYSQGDKIRKGILRCINE